MDKLTFCRVMKKKNIEGFSYVPYVLVLKNSRSEVAKMVVPIILICMETWIISTFVFHEQ
ncbi:hypothetical protein H5410_031002 [Solanum commersonii]|uniref:Uncharacterized protein n=1 Tax=Solanum commersonii TaxID=4109 RepID=A0A9J5YJ04_SOLCO|nr:hypothetical protein H5410_031002 [Solanum commersonii]